MARYTNIYVAVGAIAVQATANIMLMRGMKKAYETVIEDQQERIKIYDETVNYLLERADDRTLVELNEKLDFWRVIRGIDPPE